MNFKRPYFSIVIPTRNRAHTIGYAVKSAMNQTYEDYEVVVSINDSDDDTERVVNELADSKVRLFFTEKPLSMPDSWEFALSKAKGEWILFLCDDDALLPNCLSCLDKVINNNEGVLVYQYLNVQYTYNDGIESKGNYVEIFDTNGPVLKRIKSNKKLKAVFRGISGDMPKFLNSAVSRVLIDKIREKNGRIFQNWAPDYSVGIQLLAYTDTYIMINKPLMVWGKNIKSYGSGSRVDPYHLLEFCQQFKEFDGKFKHSPFPELMCITNGLYDTLYIVRDILGPSYRNLEVDKIRYYESLLSDINVYIKCGYEDYKHYLEPIDKKLRGTRYIVRKFYRVGRRILKKFDRDVDQNKGRIILGDSDYQFNNIFEAAELISNLIYNEEDFN